MRYLIFIFAITLTGCVTLPDLKSQVSITIACDSLRGEIGSSCNISVPSDTDVIVDGENIYINFESRK